MLKRLTWMSLVLLLITLIYWPIAANVGEDISRIDDEHDFKHSASFVIGKNEFAWIVDCRHILIWHANVAVDDVLPLIGKHALVDVLFHQLKWTREPVTTRLFLMTGVTRLDATSLSGSPVTTRIFHMRIFVLAGVLTVVPIVAGMRIGYRQSRRQWRRSRVRRVRRARVQMFLCGCGFDLRHSHARCPECGRAIRWVPVNVPTLRRADFRDSNV